jgi:hypothetical protein
VNEQFVRSGVQHALERITTDVVEKAIMRNLATNIERLLLSVRKADIYQQ